MAPMSRDTDLNFDDLMAEQTEIIATKQKHIRRLDAENQRLREDIATINKESFKQQHKIQNLETKIDRQTTQNALLQSQVDTETVSMELYQEMYCKLISWKHKMEELQRQNKELNAQNMSFRQQLQILEEELDAMKVRETRVFEKKDEELFELKTRTSYHETQLDHMQKEMQWKNAENSMIRTSWKQDVSAMKTRVDEIENERDRELMINSIERLENMAKAENRESTENLDSTKENTFIAKSYDMLSVLSSKSVTGQRVKRFRFKFWKKRRRNQQVTMWKENWKEAKLLACGFVEIINDKETQIHHLKQIKQVLGREMDKMEETNISLRNSIDVLSQSQLLSIANSPEPSNDSELSVNT